MARKTYVPLSTKYSENPKGIRAKFVYTMGGLPPGASVLVYDLLYQIEVNNEYRSVVTANCIIESDGYLRLENLRDSRYSVEFQNIDYLKYNYIFEIGDPNEFSNIVYHEIPYPVTLSPMQTGLDGSYNAYLQLNWALDSHNIDGFYEIWLASGVAPLSYYLATTIKNTRARSYNISSLEYNTTYYAKIRTTNEDGLSRGFSNEVSATTPVNTISGGFVLDTLAPINAQCYE